MIHDNVSWIIYSACLTFEKSINIFKESLFLNYPSLPVFPVPLLQIEMYRVHNSQVSWLC